MNRIVLLLVFIALGWGAAHAATSPTNSAGTDRILMIEASSMRIGTGKATLVIGALKREGGIYTGDYRLKIFPYFFKNEKGRLAIVVSDESLAEVGRGKIATVTGTATTSGKGGKTRSFTATATPANIDGGTLKLWFTAGDRKMTFAPAYHFVGKPPAIVLAQPVENNVASSSTSRPSASLAQPKE